MSDRTATPKIGHGKLQCTCGVRTFLPQYHLLHCPIWQEAAEKAKAPQSADQYIQEIVWTRLEFQPPPKKGRYRIRNAKGYESVGHYFPEEPDEDAGWVTMDFDGSIDYWAELNS